MSMMPFAKQAVSKARKSIYDSLELEEVVVDIEYYSSDNEEEQRQRERRSPSIEDSKFGILAAATTLTSLRESRPACPPISFRPQEEEEPRRKFNIAHIALPLKNDLRAPINIFVKHEVVAEPVSPAALVPVTLLNESAAAAAGPGPSNTPQASSAAANATSAKFVITNPPVELGPSSSSSSDHSYVPRYQLPENGYGTFYFDTQSSAASRSKSTSTPSSESSLPCEVSSTVTENNLGSPSDQNGMIFVQEPSHAPQRDAACSSSSSSSGIRNGDRPTAKFKCSKCSRAFTCFRGLQSHMKAHKRRFRFTAKPHEMQGFDGEYDDSRDKDYEQRPMIVNQSALVTETWTTEDIPSGSNAIKIEPPGEDAPVPKLFTCEHCCKGFTGLKGLKIHLKSHEKRADLNGEPRQAVAENSEVVEAQSFEESFAMDLMGQGDDDEEAGVDDLEGAAIVGNGTKPEGRMFLCTLCGKRFCRRNHLIFHLRIHSGERPYPCNVCTARFSRADSLKVHMRIHTGERPYVCDICGAAFAQMINANVHRRCHTGEKPFSCEECGARFIKKDGLTVHRRIHTGEKPYSCDQCGARFAYRSCILSHYKVHNGELLYRCEKCNAGFALLCNLTRHKRVHAEEEASA